MNDEFQLSLEEMPDSEALESEKKAIQQELVSQGSRIARLHWALTRETVLDGLQKCLGELDVVRCFAKGWSTAIELQTLARQTLATPGLEKELPLAKHSLSVVVHPLVTIHCDPISLPTLRFTLQVDAAVEGAVLVIRNGKLVALEAAQLRPSAILSYGDCELKRAKLKPIQLAAPYQFADGGLEIRT